ncbi:FAD-dependent oxidoreductase [Propioniciclava coleopterorum]|uniref:FAD-dependent oxidoreductase n=1 Tax=Propioniciclava coleopterorum TaxID=2714937 RepID=UPI001981BC17|nr:FAD-dependent oxidoreductase [Propioniciclava coleopterorum]
MPQRPPRVVIVGAGPSGLFAANALLKNNADVRIDVLDRLPTPYGLLRYGVAPDHASMQGIQRALAAPFASDRVRFFGMVELGRTIAQEELVEGYDAVIYAAGASEDRRLGVPGEDLPGSRSAREFVAWYCGHPDAEPQSLAGVRSAVAFGVGNVAIDVARVLAAPHDRIVDTDMPVPVVAELRAAQVRDVFVVGRRGPQHASFTTPELRELLTLPGVQPVLDPADLDGIDEEGLDRRVTGNLAALREVLGRHVPDARVRLHLLFWWRPVAFEGDPDLTEVVLERTAPDDDDRVVGTGELRRVDADLALRAIGYRGRRLPGVPFDDVHGVVPHEAGRVLEEHGARRANEYVVGWIKRGPVGVIGTNKSDAAATVATLLADLDAGQLPSPTGPDAAAVLAARGVVPSTFEDWQRIDAEELARGVPYGRPRIKVATWHALTELVRHGRAGGPLTHEDDPGPEEPEDA